ncbi:unnamed protein product [Dimorphilus gyrociliatus]|uniref:Uncharacterized protein n=1 Tax=Dimorphilus gyrociliatus TaxID=2664684 RepID=A0A7I8VAY3_9ANNE|nr:unnamed protein product [Dimorphilus gyrociliatus]
MSMKKLLRRTDSITIRLDTNEKRRQSIPPVSICEKPEKPSVASGSCPNLNEREQVNKTAIRHSISSDARLQYKSISSGQRGQNLLQVPDLFTTSHEHSQNMKKPLGKSLSDSPILKISMRSSEFRDDSGLGRPLILPVLRDQLYIGNREAALNEGMLCKFQISCLVDLTNEQVPPFSNIPCPCGADKHPRAALRLNIDFKHHQEMLENLEKINKFIKGI